jgi:DNA-binding IclR family transcriptional regulator
MVLDHYMRQADPVLQHAIPFMKELVALTGFDCVISGYHGHQILDTHHELSSAPSDLSYGRGRPRPLFRGAAPKVILSTLSSAQLRKMFDANHLEVIAAGLPSEWNGFRKHYLAIRNAGHYISMGEVDQNIAAVAVPLSAASSGIQGALALVTSFNRMTLIDQTKLIQMLQRAALDITSRIK